MYGFLNFCVVVFVQIVISFISLWALSCCLIFFQFLHVILEHIPCFFLQVQKKRSDLKLVVASATLDAEVSWPLLSVRESSLKYYCLHHCVCFLI